MRLGIKYSCTASEERRTQYVSKTLYFCDIANIKQTPTFQDLRIMRSSVINIWNKIFKCKVFHRNTNSIIKKKTQQNQGIDWNTEISLLTFFFNLFCLAVGVQAPPALPQNQRVPVAGGTHCLRHQGGGCGGGWTWVCHATEVCREITLLQFVRDRVCVCLRTGSTDFGLVCTGVWGAHGHPCG